MDQQQFEERIQDLQSRVLLLTSEVSRLKGLIEGMQEGINRRFEALEDKDE